MGAHRRSSRCPAWSLLKSRKHVLINFVFAMVVVSSLLSLVSAEVASPIHHISRSLQGRIEMQQGVFKWRSRRVLQMTERQAPRSFPPPQGNALVNNPRNAPPGRPFFNQNGRPAARIPDNARRLVPPPHP
ncbi:hypothetical protein M758_9G034400 [Ceratodon purpureus]|nr:hypothetical protein M758_9G034400 [Ceratodon purpureus]